MITEDAYFIRELQLCPFHLETAQSAWVESGLAASAWAVLLEVCGLRRALTRSQPSQGHLGETWTWNCLLAA